MAADTGTDISRISSYFNADRGILQGKVFGDPIIYQQELDSIFRRSWLFVAPANWLSNSGDFVTTRMGEAQVLVWRGDDLGIRVLMNLCPAGHQPLCLVARGQADSLVCPCHGWRYDSRGRRSRLPDQQLVEIARVDDYKGLIFANCDQNAAPLAVWLGDFTWYLDLLLGRGRGGVEAYGDDAVRWTVAANWKVPAQAFCGDTYRQLNTDSGRDDVGVSVRSLAQEDGFQVFTDVGAMTILSPPPIPRRASADSLLGQPRDGFVPTIGTVFPTLSFDWRTPSLHVWHPIGAAKTEIHSFCMVDSDAPAGEKESARRAFQFRYGPAGILSQSETDLWRSITDRASRHRDLTLNFQMGLCRDRSANVVGRVGDLFSDSNQRAFFGWWQQQLAVRSEAPRRWLRMPGR